MEDLNQSYAAFDQPSTIVCVVELRPEQLGCSRALLPG